jgi:serine/threonine protein kinase
LSQLNLLGLFSYSHPSGKSTCQFQGNYALVGDARREVVWTLFTYGGCNKGGSFILYYRRQEECVLVDPNLVLHMYKYKELSKATNNFNKSELVGTGGFGAVYKGTLPSGAVVAVKRMRMETKHGKESFQAEVTSLSQIRHRNLVQLQGWCHHEEQLLLIYDYMCNGSLDEWLFHLSTPKGEESLTIDEHKVLPLTLRHSIMRGVATALAYLHEECPQCVLHRDIKSSNVLLDGDWNAYLGDFGLARLIDHQKMEKTTMMAGTLGYMAPEMMYTSKATKESDVYSFGVLMLEVLCGTRVLERNAIDRGEGMLVDRAWRAHKARNLLEIADPGLEATFPSCDVQELELGREFEQQEASLIIPKACNDHVGESMLYIPNAIMENKMITNLLHLGLLCCNPNPEDRPSMCVVLQLLQLLEDMEMSLPPLPDHIPQVSQLPMLYSMSKSSSSGANTQDNAIQEVLPSTPSSFSVFSMESANKMQTPFGVPESSVFSGSFKVKLV